jgi:hypothetical protein
LKRRVFTINGWDLTFVEEVENETVTSIFLGKLSLETGMLEFHTMLEDVNQNASLCVSFPNSVICLVGGSCI